MQTSVSMYTDYEDPLCPTEASYGEWTEVLQISYDNENFLSISLNYEVQGNSPLDEKAFPHVGYVDVTSLYPAVMRNST